VGYFSESRWEFPSEKTIVIKGQGNAVSFLTVADTISCTAG
jgi:hypothetical protein